MLTKNIDEYTRLRRECGRLVSEYTVNGKIIRGIELQDEWIEQLISGVEKKYGYSFNRSRSWLVFDADEYKLDSIVIKGDIVNSDEEIITVDETWFINSISDKAIRELMDGLRRVLACRTM